MARLSREGWTLSKIGEKYGITRQAVSQHLKKAAKEGNVVELNFHGCPLTRDPNINYRPRKENNFMCVVCGNKCSGNKKKVCSHECRSKLVSINNTKDSKWSRKTIQSLICKGCGVVFERSNYLLSIAAAGGCENTYCSRECYCRSYSPRR